MNALIRAFTLFSLLLPSFNAVHAQLAGASSLVSSTAPYAYFGFKSEPSYDFHYVSDCEAITLAVPGARISLTEAALPESGLVKLEVVPAHFRAATPGELINLLPERQVVRFSGDTQKMQASFNLKVALDPNLFPAWVRADDLRAMAYNEEQQAWHDVLITAFDSKRLTLTIEGDHFGDFIAGVIQSPEHPTSNSNVETTIKDFKAVAPDVGFVDMSVPQANSQGNVEAEYPLTIPPGRAGMEPLSKLVYSSNAGNGLMGVGWNYIVPVITIDTRWGVPEYDEERESETYLYQGAQLFPVANREDWVPRVSERSFRPRREQRFDQIIRHGDAPHNYWWEVVEKNGTRHYYGGLPGSGRLANGVLRVGSNVGTWFLVRSEDANGNTVNYRYREVREKGQDEQFSVGVNRYIERIDYTGYGNNPGYYSIRFELDLDLNESVRADVFDDCSLGFKRSTANLLRRIVVLVNDSPLRTYDLQYSPSVLGKQQLRRITHLDQGMNTFYDHDFTYYDDLTVEGRFTPLYAGLTTEGVRDGLKGNLTVNVGGADIPSMLGGNGSHNFFAGIAVTIGPVGSSICKNNTGGYSYTFSRSKGYGINTFLDFNGDGLPDKVFVKDGALMFRANLGLGAGGLIYFEGQPVDALLPSTVGNNDFSKSTTKTHSYGPEAIIRIGGGGFGIGGYVAKSTTKAKTTHAVYMDDFNADGLVDLVINNRVFFNRLENGVPTFDGESAETLNPIRAGAPLSPDLAFIDEEELEEEEEPVSFAEANPLHDVVRAWRVPFDGYVRLSGAVRLLDYSSPEFDDYGQKDGVVALIENDEEEVWRASIGGADFSARSYDNIIRVRKDKFLFFRLQSRNDGAYDQVHWDPVIEYVNEDTEVPLVLLDPDGRNYYRFRASDDFLLASPQQVGMPEAGTIRIRGPFKKGIVSDTVRLEVVRYYKESQEEDANDLRETIARRTFLPNEVIDEDITIDELEINEYDRLNFMLATHSNIDWKKVSWEPIVEYTELRDAAGNTSSALTLEGNPLIMPVRAAVTPTMFNHVLSQDPQVFRMDTSSEVTVRARFRNLQSVPPIFGYSPDTDNGEPEPSITLVAKGRNHIYGIQEVLRGNTIMEQSAAIRVPYGVPQHDSIYVELIYSSKEFAEWDNGQIAVTLNGESIQPIKYAANSLLDFTLGSLYRGWGQFAYRGEGERGAEPIDVGVVREGISKYSNQSNVSFSSDPEQLMEDLNPANDDIAVFYVNPQYPRWSGYDELTYVEAELMSSSRLGEDNELDLSNEGENTRLTAPTKINISKSKGISGNIDLDFELPGQGEVVTGNQGASMPFSIPSNGSYNRSVTKAFEHTILIDLNRDGYLDAVANGFAQLTYPWGGRRPETIYIDHPSHRSEAKVVAFEPGGGVRQAKVTNTYTRNADGSLSRLGDPKINRSTTLSAGISSLGVNHAFGNGMGVGVRAASARDKDRVVYSWLDVNGDGIPDRVSATGEVRLGLGGRFTTENYYDFSKIREGVNITETFGATVGGGVPDVDLLGRKDKSKCKGSWTLGTTLKEDVNFTTYAHQDVTGDGMPDILELLDDDLYVRINLGRNYLPRQLWKENFRIDAGYTASESVNGAFTICFNIFFIRLCINPKGGVGHAVGSTRTRISDIDGDGFPDLLESDKEDAITYYRSRIGRTHLLKEVRSPLGNTYALDYELKGSSFARPSAQYVLASVSRSDGLEGDGAEPAKFTFSYDNPVHDRREREFYGYGTVITEERDPESNNLYRKRTQSFANTTYYNQGLLIGDELTDASGKRWTNIEYAFELRKPENAEVLPTGFNEVGQAVYVARTQVRSEEYEGQESPLRTLVMNYEYDRWANIVALEDLGDGSQDDYTLAKIEYHSETVRGVRDAPRKLIVTDRDGTVLRRRETDIDAAGNPLTIRNAIATDQYAETTMEYDSYGNLIRIVRPRNLHGDRFYHEMIYDDVVNTYPVVVKDAFGYRSTTTYDYAYGLPLVSSDINNQKIHRTYDDKGRLLTLTGPRELSNGKPYTIRMEYFPSGAGVTVPYAVCRHYDEEHDQDILTYTFIDGLGRPVQVKKTAVVWGNGHENTNVMTVSGKQIYDAFGRVISAFYPTIAPAGTAQNYLSQPDEVAPTRTTYDVLDRSLTVTLPDDALTTTNHGIRTVSGRPLTYQESIDPLGNRSEVLSDLRGRDLLKVRNGPDGPITTVFRYSLVDELLQVEDNDGNITSYTYDLLGRKTSVQHPLVGLTTIKLDPAGNLIAKSTPNIRQRIGERAEIRYDYDYERLKTIAYPENYQNNVRYTYGEPGADFNRAGRILLQEDGTGAQEFYYGSLGETVKTVRTVVVNPTTVLTYVYEAVYDSWNRLQKLIYPDGEIVEYAYNLAGKLSGLSGSRAGELYDYVLAVGYDEFESRTYLKLGNGTEHRYTYETDRRRLRNMRASGSSAGTFLDNSYAYDAVDNIVSLENTARPTDGQIGGSSRITYQYDELYRMTEADGVFNQQGREETYSLTMAYDNVHNIIAKDQLHQRDGIMLSRGSYVNAYAYDDIRPFLATQIGDKDYEYDANGNLVKVTDRSRYHIRDMFWDEENRLMAVQDEGYLSRYSYDADGQRVIKSHGPIRGQSFNGEGGGFVEHVADYTAYVSPFFVAQNGRFTKHYFIEGQRVSTKVGQGEFNNNSATPGQGRLAAGNQDFIARIRQLRGRLRARFEGMLMPGRPDRPLQYTTPQYTGEQYPDLFPENVSLVSGGYAGSGLPVLDPDGIAPAFQYQDTNFDTVRAGFNVVQPEFLQREILQYFYHSDHLGSTAYVTDIGGDITQFTAYTAFGETFVDGHRTEATGASQPYLFNGKELDGETGLYYYGARYYDPVTSLWASVDPMMDHLVGWSPYNYTLQNPVKLTDPDGRFPFVPMAVGAGLEYGFQVAANLANGQSVGSALKNVDLKSIAFAAVMGATGAGIEKYIKGAKIVKKGFDVLIAGATTAAIESVADQALSGDGVNAREVYADAVNGMIFSGLNNVKLGKKVIAGLERKSVRKNIKKTLSPFLSNKSAHDYSKKVQRGLVKLTDGALQGTKAALLNMDAQTIDLYSGRIDHQLQQ